MIWLYILIGIIIFFAIVSLIPVKIFVSYFDEFKCTLVVGFVKFSIYPPKPKKKRVSNKPGKKSDKEKKDKEPEEKKQGLIKEKGLAWLVELLKKAANLAASALKDFFKHILIKKFDLSIRLVGSDAADTAVKFGKCCAAVYPAVSVITSTVRCPKYGIDIMPDFDENAKTQIELEFEARVFVYRIAELVLKHGFKAIRLLIDLKN